MPFGSEQWMYASSGGFYPYEIDQSLRFNDDDTAYLSRTPASAGNRKTWTWSGWVKRGQIGVSGVYPHFGISAGTANNSSVARSEMMFTPSSNIVIGFNPSGSSWYESTTNAVFRDPSAWYHIVVSVDMTQATDTNRLKLWVNGALQTFSSYSVPAQNTDLTINNTTQHAIGDYVAGLSTSSYNFDGYMAEVNFIDGQALDPTSFGQFKSGVWIPKSYSGSYGTNGFYLDFGNSGSLGADSSGNGNNWTPNNLAATDQVSDSPTNNFCTLPSTSKSTYLTLSEGNLKTLATSSSYWATAHGSFGISSGKWYWEVYLSTSSVGWNRIGIQSSTENVAGNQNVLIGDTIDSWCYRVGTGQSMNNSTTYTYGATAAQGDVIGVALDMDNGTLTFYKNNSSQGIAFSSLSGTYVPATSVAIGDSANGNISNFGQDSSFAGATTAQGNTDANGIGDFYYAPPADYLALCTANLPDTAIDPAQDDVPADYFNTVLYTATGNDNLAITGVGFQPDFTWIKSRSSAYSHNVYDAVRGVSKRLQPNLTNTESSPISGVKSFDADGFTLGNVTNDTNFTSGVTYASWNWLADNTSGSANTDGTIASTVSANEKAGFSIVSYTGNGTGGATIGHGLSQAPDMVILKGRSVADGWYVYSESLGGTKFITLNEANAAVTASSIWNNTNPSSTVVTLGTNGGVNGSGSTYIAYCFHSVEGYSKIGSYTGNGSTNGPFIYTGFQPAFVLMKDTGSAEQWQMVDSARDTYNVVDSALFPNSSNAEGTSATIHRDFLSNGFKVRTSDTSQNASGRTYIYMAFAEMPFKYSLGR